MMSRVVFNLTLSLCTHCLTGELFLHLNYDFPWCAYDILIASMRFLEKVFIENLENLDLSCYVALVVIVEVLMFTNCTISSHNPHNETRQWTLHKDMVAYLCLDIIEKQLCGKPQKHDNSLSCIYRPQACQRQFSMKKGIIY